MLRFKYTMIRDTPSTYHSSANKSGEDERQWARFNIVIRRDRL